MELRQIERLGLTKNEALIYLALLELGGSTSGGIIKKTGIHGSKVYAALERLKRKNLVNYVIKSGKKSFAAADPCRLLELEHEREDLVKQLLPELKQLHKRHLSSVNIEIYEEREGLKNIIQKILGCRHFEVLASEDEIFPDYSDYLSKQIIKKDIIVKALVKKKLMESIKNQRLLPDYFLSPFSIVIYDKKVAMIVYAEKPYAILIESESVSKKYRNYFEMLWKISRKI